MIYTLIQSNGLCVYASCRIHLIIYRISIEIRFTKKRLQITTLNRSPFNIYILHKFVTQAFDCGCVFDTHCFACYSLPRLYCAVQLVGFISDYINVWMCIGIFKCVFVIKVAVFTSTTVQTIRM